MRGRTSVRFDGWSLAVAVVSSVNNDMLPLWMIVFGIVPVRQKDGPKPVQGA
jgi:hypothetical protein